MCGSKRTIGALSLWLHRRGYVNQNAMGGKLLGHMDQLLQAETSTLYDSTIITMTWDSMEPFFKDEKTYEACFDELKSKLTIYMDE